MTAPNSCVAPVDWTCVPEATTTRESELRQEAANAAVATVYGLTGRRFGCCPMLVRPCPTGWDPYGTLVGGWNGHLFAYLENGLWRNSLCGCGDGKCSTLGPRSIHLHGPVCTIIEVVVNGVALAPTDYRLEGDVLYRVGGDWPTQNLQIPLNEDGTFSVLYDRGVPWPPGTAAVVGELAGELFKQCCGKPCALPKRVQSVSRQGLSLSMVDPNTIISQGFTGLERVDQFIQVWNPSKLQRPPKVSSPDVPNGLGY